MADDGISEGQTDLFGLPLLRERGRGRPAHVWTEENSNKVSLLFACGHKAPDVAKVLGITKPTFYKHYFNEIARAGHAPLMMKARQLERLNKAAESGSVPAEKALAGMIQAEQVRTMGEKIRERGKSDTPPAQRLGKKEAAKEAAASASGKFAARTPPPMMLN